MKCETCGIDFKPSDEVKRLMVTGAVAQVCNGCEVAPDGADVFKKRVVFSKRHTWSTLHRVDKFGPDGLVKEWMALLPVIKHRAGQIKKGTWRHHHSPFVMSENAGRPSNVPTLTLVDNLKTFQHQGVLLKIRKIPGSADAMTGIDCIAVNPADVAGIKDDGGLELNVHLKDGGRLRFLYRN